MKKMLTILSLVSICSTAMAGKSVTAAGRTDAQKTKLVKVMAADQLKKDIRTRVEIDPEGICGADGPSFIVSVEMRKSVRDYDEKTGEVKLIDQWEVVKQYGATSSELNGKITPGLMDSESCME